MEDPRSAQTQAFDRVARLLRGTDVGRESGLDACRSLEDCRRLVVSDAESMRPLFRRIFEQGRAAGAAIGRSRLVGFARTSGTEGEPKEMPMNGAYVSSLDRALTRMVASRLFTAGDWSSLLSRRQILVGSRPKSGVSPTGLPVCDISGFIPTRTWRAMRHVYIPRHADLWIEDWAAKADRILEQAQGKDVVSIAGIPALATDLAARVKAKFGVRHLTELWPNLCEYVYGAVHLAAEERARIADDWLGPGRPLQFYETYIATEAVLGFTFDSHDEGMALNAHENVYLFCPHPRADALLFADELREGQAYAVHVTTPGGLVNYRIGDLVEVVSTRPLQVRVARREADELSMTGEKITLAQVDLALAASGLGPARLGRYKPAVWVELGRLPGLVWAIPAPDGGAPVDPRCAARLDQELCLRNVLYAEALVHERVVGKSRVVVLPRSVFAQYERGRLGVAQFKPKRLFSSRHDFSSAYSWTTPPLAEFGEVDSAGS